MSNENDYDLKKSKSIGELYPVLKDARGNIIDGNHRLQADPNWKAQVIPEIDTDEKLILARLVSNWQRRQVTSKEKAEWINGLAEIYRSQGYKCLITSNEIVRKIVKETGLSQPTINAYLDDKYKVFTDKDRVRKPEISAHERIRHLFGEEFAERHEQEVLKKHQVRSPFMNIPDIPDQNNTEELEEKKKIQDSKPALAETFVAKGGIFTVEIIRESLERFNMLDSSILTDLNDLNAEQKEKVLALLLESRKKIDEMVKALKDEK